MINPWKFVKSLIVQTENSTSPAAIEIFPAGTSNTRTTITSSQTSDITVTLPSTTSTLATTASLGTVATDLSNHISDATDAHAASAITNTPAGNLAATEVQAALNELQSDVDTRALASDLNNHITDGVDAHDASAISNIPSGNLAATDIQAAVNELQSDIDTRALASALTDHISDTTGAHAASAISSIPAGNLAATDVQTALDELQSDIDTRALAADLTNHINDTADAHDASAISVVPAGNLAATEVQAALTELQTDIDGRAEQRNLIAGGRADLGVILIPYADAAGTSPVDGTGGTPNVTAAINTTTPLDGSADFLLTKDAANRQGEGWAIPFTVAPANRAKVLSIKFDYIINSGTFVAGGPSSNSDITVWIYDVTNSRIIQPSNIKLFSNNATISDIFQAEFQTSAAGEDYRLLLHVGSTSALAYTLRVDNLEVVANEYTFGTPVTDWQSYTPNINAVSGTLTNFTTAFRWRRVGDSIEVDGALTFTGAPGTWTSPLVSLPSGITQVTTGDQNQGQATIIDTGVNTYVGAISNHSPTQVVVIAASLSTHVGTVGIPHALITNTFPYTFASGDIFRISFRRQVSGWSSAVQVSDNADTRIVAVRRTINASQSMASGVPTKVTVLGGGQYDTHAGWDGPNTRYIVPVSGFYRFSGALLTQLSLTTAGNNRQLYLYRNGTVVSASLIRDDSAAVNSKTVSHADVISCVAGDILEMYVSIEGSAPAITADSTRGFLSIERVTGPSAIAATERVSFGASTSAGQVVNITATDIVFGTQEEDTHSSYNPATGEFIAPTAGLYRFSWNVLTTAVNLSTAQRLITTLVVDGVNFKNGFRTVGVGASTNYCSSGSVSFTLSAGQVVKLQASSSVATNLDATSINNYFCGERIGL